MDSEDQDLLHAKVTAMQRPGKGLKLIIEFPPDVRVPEELCQRWIESPEYRTAIAHLAGLMTGSDDMQARIVSQRTDAGVVQIQPSPEIAALIQSALTAHIEAGAGVHMGMYQQQALRLWGAVGKQHITQLEPIIRALEDIVSHKYPVSSLPQQLPVQAPKIQS